MSGEKFKQRVALTIIEIKGLKKEIVNKVLHDLLFEEDLLLVESNVNKKEIFGTFLNNLSIYLRKYDRKWFEKKFPSNREDKGFREFLDRRTKWR